MISQNLSRQHDEATFSHSQSTAGSLLSFSFHVQVRPSYRGVLLVLALRHLIHSDDTKGLYEIFLRICGILVQAFSILPAIKTVFKPLTSKKLLNALYYGV